MGYRQVGGGPVVNEPRVEPHRFVRIAENPFPVLLEEERNIGVRALVSQRPCPVEMHRSPSLTRFTAGDDPVERSAAARERFVRQNNPLEQRLERQETRARAQPLELDEAATSRPLIYGSYRSRH